jgi:hypothetical protein
MQKKRFVNYLLSTSESCSDLMVNESKQQTCSGTEIRLQKMGMSEGLEIQKDLERAYQSRTYYQL